MSVTPTTDEDVSLALQKRQEDKKWINYSLTDSLVEGYYGYPVFLHFVISKIKKKNRWLIGKFINIFSDIIIGILIYQITNKLIGVTLLSYFNYGHIASLLYITSPLLIPVTSRMKTIKARSFGSMLIFFYFYFMYLMMNSFNFGLLILLFFIAFLIVISSMFAFQVMLLMSLFLSLLSFSFDPVIYLAGFLFILFFIKQLKAKEPILFYFNHKIWYFKNFTKGTKAQNRQLFSIIKWKNFYNKPKLILQDLLRNQPILIVLFSLPELFFLMDYLKLNIVDNQLLSFSWNLIISTIILFLLTSTKYFSFLGQSERYFEYTLPFICLLVTFTLYNKYDPNFNLIAVLFIVIWHIIIIVINFIFSNNYLFDEKKKIDISFKEVIDFLNQNFKNGGNVMTNPVKLGFKASAYSFSSNFKFYYKFIKKKNEIGFKYYEKDTNGILKKNEEFIQSKEIISLTPDEMIEKYKINFLIIQNKNEILEGVELMWKNKYLKHQENIIFQNNDYILYLLKNNI